MNAQFVLGVGAPVGAARARKRSRLRAIHALLTYVLLADAYIASGLIVLALGWRALSALSTQLV